MEMKMSLEILPMEKKYLSSAKDIYQWYVANTTATFQIRDADTAEMEALLFFDNDKYRSFAVFEDGVFIGYGIITQFKSREAFANTAEITVYLSPESTGKGYGRAILAHLESFSRSSGLHALVALISGENEGSCKLFARNGYAKCAHYHEVGFKFGRWIDLVCYEKLL
jgi:L-amino acid N-acyltransferase YncA